MAALVLVSSMATRAILGAALQACHAATGIAVDLMPMGGVEAASRIRAGMAADLVLLASGAMAGLVRDGHVLAESLTPFAGSDIAVAIPAGAAPPDLASADAVRKAMLAARAVCYSTGPSGDHLKRLWQRWDITAEMAARAVQVPAGVPVASIVAAGDADFGIQQLSELIGQPGIAILPDLPADVRFRTVFTGGIAAGSAQHAAAAQVLAWLASPATLAIRRAGGMDAP